MADQPLRVRPLLVRGRVGLAPRYRRLPGVRLTARYINQLLIREIQGTVQHGRRHFGDVAGQCPPQLRGHSGIILQAFRQDAAHRHVGVARHDPEDQFCQLLFARLQARLIKLDGRQRYGFLAHTWRVFVAKPGD